MHQPGIEPGYQAFSEIYPTNGLNKSETMGSLDSAVKSLMLNIFLYLPLL
jgi:hypothetical protein